MFALKPFELCTPPTFPRHSAAPTSSAPLSPLCSRFIFFVPTTLLFSAVCALFQKSAHLIENNHYQVPLFSRSCALFCCTSFSLSILTKTYGGIYTRLRCFLVAAGTCPGRGREDSTTFRRGTRSPSFLFFRGGTIEEQRQKATSRRRHQQEKHGRKRDAHHRAGNPARPRQVAQQNTAPKTKNGDPAEAGNVEFPSRRRPGDIREEKRARHGERHDHGQPHSMSDQDCQCGQLAVRDFGFKGHADCTHACWVPKRVANAPGNICSHSAPRHLQLAISCFHALTWGQAGSLPRKRMWTRRRGALTRVHSNQARVSPIEYATIHSSRARIRASR
jgi:hypothetical protein